MEQKKRIGIVFPGYGEQFIGMGKDLYDELRIVQEFFEQAAGTAETNFVKLMFASSDEEISSVRCAYVAIYLYEAALYEVLYQKGLRPDFVAGHGIGEYAAAYCSRSLSFVDALYILNKYSQFYDDFLKDKDYTSLRIVREFEVESIEELCQTKSTENNMVYVSAQNTAHAFYLAGAEKTIEKIRQYCIDEVIRKVKIIGPAYGMHSSLVDPIVEQLKLYYHKIKFNPLQVPVITNVDGVYVTSPESLESAIMRKINNRIQWYEVIKGFEGCDVILSIGPGTQLIEWFKEVYPDKEYHVVSAMKDFAAIEYLWQQDEVVVADQVSEQVVQDISHPISTEQTVETEKPKDLYEADIVNELPSDFDVEED